MAKLKQVTRRLRFENRCERASKKTGYSVAYYNDPPGTAAGIYQDDGTLHVSKYGLRACFWIFNDDPAIQNERARAVLAALRLMVPDSALSPVQLEPDC